MAQEEQPKKGAPAWMVSFGDMMTLILTFFILLVSMSKERQQGLVARGVGSFMIALRSFGMPGLMDDAEQVAIHDNVRRRFNLPPEEDPERRTPHVEASSLELIRAQAAEALTPHDEISQPAIAMFEQGSAVLDDAARSYLDLLAPTLVPAVGQLLLLEGHARDATAASGGNHALLAFRRAKAVREYLIDKHDFEPERVEARAWLAEIDPSPENTRNVDARLVIPRRGED